MVETHEEAKRQKALGLALAHVNRRERTVAEIRVHLERKGVSETCAEAAVEELVAQHLVDDERFAELFVTDKRELEQWGIERIRRGLASRGIDRECAERALAAADSAAVDRGGAGVGAGGDAMGRHAGDTGRDLTASAGSVGVTTELDRALQLLRRRFPDPPRDRRDRDRALGVLLRKGYESELALDALAAHARGA